jgi:hypothetical protein
MAAPATRTAVVFVVIIVMLVIDAVSDWFGVVVAKQRMLDGQMMGWIFYKASNKGSHSANRNERERGTRPVCTIIHDRIIWGSCQHSFGAGFFWRAPCKNPWPWPCEINGWALMMSTTTATMANVAASGHPASQSVVQGGNEQRHGGGDGTKQPKRLAWQQGFVLPQR